ncbi:MAG: hypothetical protein WBF99_23525 [Xanthobacteraceae bacterium]
MTSNISTEKIGDVIRVYRTARLTLAAPLAHDRPCHERRKEKSDAADRHHVNRGDELAGSVLTRAQRTGISQDQTDSQCDT